LGTIGLIERMREEKERQGLKVSHNVSDARKGAHIDTESMAIKNKEIKRRKKRERGKQKKKAKEVYRVSYLMAL
jgi:ABC-type cobalamin/Fe3+-siderophores transport system ATPase subunit